MHTRGSHVRRAVSVLSIGALLLTGVAATAAAEPAPEGAPTTLATDEPAPTAVDTEEPAPSQPAPAETDDPEPAPVSTATSSPVAPAPQSETTEPVEPTETGPTEPTEPTPTPTEAQVTLSVNSTSARVVDLQRALDEHATRDYYWAPAPVRSTPSSPSTPPMGCVPGRPTTASR